MRKILIANLASCLLVTSFAANAFANESATNITLCNNSNKLVTVNYTEQGDTTETTMRSDPNYPNNPQCVRWGRIKPIAVNNILVNYNLVQCSGGLVPNQFYTNINVTINADETCHVTAS